MQFDTRTIVLVVGRLTDLASVPCLFNDRMPPSNVIARLDRVLDWLGPGGRMVACDYIRRREIPKPGKRQWSRGDYARGPVVAGRMR